MSTHTPAGAIPAATARESHLLPGDLFGASSFLTQSAPEIGCLCPLLLRWQSDATCVTAVSECTLAAFRLSSDDNTGASPPLFKCPSSRSNLTQAHTPLSRRDTHTHTHTHTHTLTH
jgi:hypothetical protein